jgi:hypothetical protein
LSFAISSTSFFEDLPNKPQDLHASITTAPSDRGAESVEDISVRLRLGGMVKTLAAASLNIQELGVSIVTEKFILASKISSLPIGIIS